MNRDGEGLEVRNGSVGHGNVRVDFGLREGDEEPTLLSVLRAKRVKPTILYAVLEELTVVVASSNSASNLRLRAMAAEENDE